MVEHLFLEHQELAALMGYLVHLVILRLIYHLLLISVRLIRLE